MSSSCLQKCISIDSCFVIKFILCISKTKYCKSYSTPVYCSNFIKVLFLFKNFHELYCVVWCLAFTSVGKEKYRDFSLSVKMINLNVFKINHLRRPSFFSCFLSEGFSYFGSSTSLRSIKYLNVAMLLFLLLFDNFLRLWFYWLFSFLKRNYKQS